MAAQRKKGKPHEGPEGERQPRLPGIGTGFFGGGSAAFDPENWQQRPPGGGRIAAFHSSMEMTMPAEDRPEQAGGVHGGSIDSRGRPLAHYGSAIGIHLGSLQSAMDAGFTREYIHTLAIKNKDVLSPENAPPELLQPQILASAHRNWPIDPVDPDAPHLWTDEAANYNADLTDQVEQGKVLPYRNEVEDRGSTSYRGKPEALETWGEHVRSTEHEHAAVDHINTSDDVEETGGRVVPDPGFARSRPSRAQVAAAKAGYEPTILQQQNTEEIYLNPIKQPTLFEEGTDERDRRRMTSHYGEPGSPEADRWDHAVRTTKHAEQAEALTEGRDQRAAVLRRITMIQAGRREDSGGL